MVDTSILMLAAAAASGTALPDIEIKARVQAERVKIEQQGRASARVRLEPSGDERIDVERNLPRGKSTYRNLDLRLTIEGRLADPAAARANASVTIQDQGDLNMTRGHGFFATSVFALALAASPAQAQQRQAAPTNSPAVAYLSQVPASEQPDVVLDVPNLSVEQLTLEVQGLEAHISLDARLANLLRLNAGADVTLESVKLDIKGVQASAALVVRLDNVRAIIERTLQTLDNNPQIITELTGTLDNAVGVTGGVLNNTVDTVGDLTSDVLRSGAVLDLANSGLSAVSQTVNAAGQTVRRLRASDGSLYEVVTDAANRIVSSSRVGSPG